MLVSHSHEFLFVHIQRTGGGSVSRVLADYVDHPRKQSRMTRVLHACSPNVDPRKMYFSAHAVALDVKRRWPAEMYERYFKFAFVRNPWSWLVSLHARVGSTPSHRHAARVSKMSFAEYVDWEIRRDKRHQHRFVCDENGELIVDFIGRLENLQPDIAHVCERLGVPAPEELPQIGSRKHAPWRSCYDDETRERVARHWQRDIELFGYAFEGEAAPAGASKRR